MNARSKKKKIITWNGSECRNCYACEYICSLRLEGVFNPLKSLILIVGNRGKYTVSFGDDCDNCGRCVKACPYGALDQVRQT